MTHAEITKAKNKEHDFDCLVALTAFKLDEGLQLSVKIILTNPVS